MKRNAKRIDLLSMLRRIREAKLTTEQENMATQAYGIMKMQSKLKTDELSCRQVKYALRGLGYCETTQKGVRRFLRELDHDDSDGFTLDEFKKIYLYMITQDEKGTMYRLMERVFQQYDKVGRKYWTLHQLARFAKDLDMDVTQKTLEDMMGLITSKDTFSFEELTDQLIS